ncbi:phage terminase small subunit [Clostridium sp. 001]|uniref:phage terminase small subunit n=1 Tax=Clostridium sp. 001 TaxID=1970093 RepID=UPI001C2C447C|nr:phage terminase small subunit [Clostridium sp. 001]QXE19527.1 terminase [Clostridium sp. 001]
MSRQRSPNRDKAFKIYKEHKGNISNKEIADLLNESSNNISVWKCRDKWEEKIKRKVGAPPGNKNAVGNSGGAPNGNLNNLRHGEYYDPTKHLPKDFLKKYLPMSTKNIIKETVESGISLLDMLWTNIQLQFAAVIRSQKIMYVKNKKEMIKELKKSKVKTKNRSTQKTSTDESDEEYEYEFQFAWDRQATFLKAQSRAMKTLESMIKQYDEMLHKNWNLATEEQKLRIEKLKAAVDKVKNNDKGKLKDGILKDMLEGLKDEI